MEKEGRRRSMEGTPGKPKRTSRKSDPQRVSSASKMKEKPATARKDEESSTEKPIMGSPDEEESIKPVEIVVDADRTEVPLIPEEEGEPPTAREISEALCKEYADELFDFALDLCHERFVHINADELIAWDLRDSLLDAVTMNWLDTEEGILSKPPNASTMFHGNGNLPPLPPKFDFWSHGALETIPRKCTESVMDPFLRDSHRFIAQNGKIEESESEPELERSSMEALVRPTSPVTTDSTDADDKWSITTSAGSFNSHKTDSAAKEQAWESSPSSAGSFARAKASLKQKSIELLFPMKFPSVQVKASSEFAYHMNRGNRWKDASDTSEISNELIAFKLPNQTSSESLIAHLERKNRQKEREQQES